MESIVPKSWNDMEMDWEAPDASIPAYGLAIEAAISERQLAINDVSITDYHIDVGGVMTYAWANRVSTIIANMVELGWFIRTPGAQPEDDDYLVPAIDVLSDDPHWLDLYVTPGDLLSSAQSVKFLKACRYFLDLLTVTESALGSKECALPSGSYILSDYWSCSPEPFADPAATDWDEFWALYAANVTKEADLDGNIGVLGYGVTGYFSVRYEAMSYSDNVRYYNRHLPAHDLLVRMSTNPLAKRAANSVFHDFTGLGYPEGWSVALSVPRGDDEDEADPATGEPYPISIPTSGLTPPTTWPDFEEWTQYEWSFLASYFIDFGVEDGFNFQKETEIIE